MNINLVYEGKDYNFDIPNGVTIDYLKELSSKIFNSEKELLDLVYNNEKVTNNDNKTLIRDLIPEGETNAILTVQINKNIKNNKKNDNKKIIPLVNLKQRNENNTTNENKNENIGNFLNENKNEENKNEENKEKNKRMKEKKKIQIFDIQNFTNNSNSYNKRNIMTNVSNCNINTNKEKLIFNELIGKAGNGNNNYNLSNILEKDYNKKILFETTYMKKNTELLALIKEFNEKIKKIHSILVKKAKNSGLISNNISSSSNDNTSRSTINLSINNNYFYELTLYENKIINFQDKQILFYKSLLEIMRKYDNTINFIKLSEFYNKLIAFNTGDNKNIFLKQLKPFKLTNIQNKKLVNSNSSINLSTLNSINKKKKLPLLYNKNMNSPMNKDKNKNIVSNSVNRVSSKNITFQKINEHKEKKVSQKNILNNITTNINTNTNVNTNKLYSKINSFIEDNNFLSNNTNTNNNNNLNKTNKKNNNNNNYESSEENSEGNIIEKINKNNNIPIPLSPKKNFSKMKSEKYLNEKGNEDNHLSRRSIKKSINKSRNVNERNYILEDQRKNDGSGIFLGSIRNKKDVKIKDINVSNMTINDSNFAREKRSTPKKNRKESLNKYDFFV